MKNRCYFEILTIDDVLYIDILIDNYSSKLDFNKDFVLGYFNSYKELVAILVLDKNSFNSKFLYIKDGYKNLFFDKKFIEVEEELKYLK